jgi:hypothetical protein
MDINEEVRHGIESFSSGRLAAAGQDHSISHVRRRVAEIQHALDRFLAIMKEHGNPGATALARVTYPRLNKKKVEHLGKAWVIGVVYLGPDSLPTRMYLTTNGKLYQENYELMECTLGRGYCLSRWWIIQPSLPTA